MDTISIQLKVEREFDNFNSFESCLIVEVRRAVLEMVKQYIEKMDIQFSRIFEQDHPDYRYNGKTSCKLRTYFGSVWINRHRYRRAGHKDIYPLASFLPESGMSRMVADLAIDLGTELPYGRSSRLLERFLGIKLSGKGIWHLIQREGRKEREIHDRERRRIFEEARDEYSHDYQTPIEQRLQPPVYIEVDGTMVSSREKGEDRFEIKNGIMYSCIQQIGKHRWRLMNKQSYTEVENSEIFSERFYAFCRKRGLNWRQPVTFISDGAGWLRSTANYVFPLAEKCLDLYHLKKACSKVLNDDEMEIINWTVYDQSAEELVGKIQNLVRSKNLSIKDQTELLTYVSQNRDSMNYSREDRNGSGGIEKNIGIHIGRRCKRQGMSWSRKGINNLLALRSKKLNQMWSETSRRYKNCR
ncbi:MAG: UPF0236 family protein [Candidatus Marinimicrobia bacterium]|nr:UPF0236 family protein [Candidatus Neomarinimicrobiota bacterium]